MAGRLLLLVNIKKLSLTNSSRNALLQAPKQAVCFSINFFFFVCFFHIPWKFSLDGISYLTLSTQTPIFECSFEWNATQWNFSICGLTTFYCYCYSSTSLKIMWRLTKRKYRENEEKKNSLKKIFVSRMPSINLFIRRHRCLLCIHSNSVTISE